MTQSTNHNPQKHWQEIAVKLAGYDPNTFQGAKTWWRNPTNHNSLRLTVNGFNWFRLEAKMVSHKVDLGEQWIKSKQLVQLERQLHEPYYIRSYNVIHVFSEQDAVMLQLHGGDLATYLQNLEDTAG